MIQEYLFCGHDVFDCDTHISIRYHGFVKAFHEFVTDDTETERKMFLEQFRNKVANNFLKTGKITLDIWCFIVYNVDNERGKNKWKNLMLMLTS